MVTTRGQTASPSTASTLTSRSAAATPSKPSTSSPLVTKSKYDPCPVSHHYEFGGPIGALFVTLSVPFFSYWLSFACFEGGCPPWPLNSFSAFHSQGWAAMIGGSSWWSSLYSHEAALVYVGWYAFTVICWAVLPGKMVQGGELRNGKKVTYPMNACATLVASLVVTAGVTLVYGLGPLLYISNNWAELITASIVMAVAQATFVHVRSYRKNEMLALGGNTSSSLYNWFIGRSLNPSIGSFDIKSFNELRPGMILWFIIDLAMAAKQYEQLGRVTDSMWLVVIFHSWYVVDALYNESAILSTMDITSDGFGFMLSVGDLVWVPFTYSYQARYLSIFPNDLGYLNTAMIIVVQLLGYWIFRSSNGEKNDFRQGKNPKNLSSLKTARGTKLLTSGWWGLSRHPNYLGDWIMAWAWCLPAGFSSPLPYFYVIYFAILLVHRQMRDDEACEIKYGKDWETYKKLVPSRIIPYIY